VKGGKTSKAKPIRVSFGREEREKERKYDLLRERKYYWLFGGKVWKTGGELRNGAGEVRMVKTVFFESRRGFALNVKVKLSGKVRNCMADPKTNGG